MSLAPKEIRLSDDKVAKYLDEIGAGEALRRRWAAQKGRVPWRETYTKHAKTFLSVGRPTGDRSWQNPVGLRFEIVPVGDPLSARTGERFAVRILHDGAPLAGIPLGIVFEGSGGARTFQTGDAKGTAVFPLARAGNAMIFSIDLRPDSDGTAWRSDFTTMTFRVAAS